MQTNLFLKKLQQIACDTKIPCLEHGILIKAMTFVTALSWNNCYTPKQKEFLNAALKYHVDEYNFHC